MRPTTQDNGRLQTLRLPPVPGARVAAFRLVAVLAMVVLGAGPATAVPPSSEEVRKKWKPAKLALPVLIDLVEEPRPTDPKSKGSEPLAPAQVAYRVRLEVGPIITLESQHYQTGAINSVRWGGRDGRPLAQAPIWLQWLAGRDATAVFADYGFDAAPTAFGLSEDEPPAVLWVAGGASQERDLPKVAVDRATGRLMATIEVPNRAALAVEEAQGAAPAAEPVVIDVRLEWLTPGDLASHVTLAERGGAQARRYALTPGPFASESEHGEQLAPQPTVPSRPAPLQPAPEREPAPPAPPIAPSSRGNAPTAPPAPPWGQ